MIKSSSWRAGPIRPRATQPKLGEKHQNAFDNQRRSDPVARLLSRGWTRAAQIRVAGGRATTSRDG